MLLKRKAGGFTLVELVVVITLVGLLAAIALPRFANVQEEAHKAAVKGATGSLQAGVALVHSKAIAQGLSPGGKTVVDLYGDSAADVAVNASGWPYGPPSALPGQAGSPTNCTEVWKRLIQGATSCCLGSDVTFKVDTSPPFSSACTYQYQPTDAIDGVDPAITYNTRTGAVAHNL